MHFATTALVLLLKYCCTESYTTELNLTIAHEIFNENYKQNCTYIN